MSATSQPQIDLTWESLNSSNITDIDKMIMDMTMPHDLQYIKRNSDHSDLTTWGALLGGTARKHHVAEIWRRRKLTKLPTELPLSKAISVLSAAAASSIVKASTHDRTQP
jgi:hypothetical protein